MKRTLSIGRFAGCAINDQHLCLLFKRRWVPLYLHHDAHVNCQAGAYCNCSVQYRRQEGFTRAARADCTGLVQAPRCHVVCSHGLLCPRGYGCTLWVLVRRHDALPEGVEWLEQGIVVQGWWRERCNCDRVLAASALEEWGVDEVKRWMLAQLPEGPTLYPKEQITEHPERFFVSEIIREHVFEQYDQEIPYSIQVCPPGMPRHVPLCVLCACCVRAVCLSPPRLT